MILSLKELYLYTISVLTNLKVSELESFPG